MKGSVHSAYKHGLGGMLPGLELDYASWNHVALEKLFTLSGPHSPYLLTVELNRCSAVLPAVRTRVTRGRMGPQV